MTAGPSSPDLLIVSRSMPPDVGGYQSQMALIAPFLRSDTEYMAWVGAVRSSARRSEDRADSRLDCTVRVPAHRLPRRIRGLSDVVVVITALLVLLWVRARHRRTATMLLLSPTMFGSRVLVHIARILGSAVVARFATAGDLSTRRGGRVASADGVTPVVLSPGQGLESACAAVAHVPNAVDLSVYADDGSRRLFADAGRFVFVGRLVARKRADALLSAWRETAEFLPGWHLDILGSGDDEADSIEALLDEALSRGDLVRCEKVGRVDDVRPFLRRADVLVFPSEREGQPNAVLEAMAMGVPVLADPKRIATWFEHPPPVLEWDGESSSLGAAMARAAADPQMRRDVARAGQAIAARHHAPGEVAKRWIDLLRSLERT